MQTLFNLNSYNFTFHALPLIFIAFLILGMGILILSKDRYPSANRHFFILCFSVFCWLMASALGYLAINKNAAYFWFRFVNFILMIIAPAFFAFVTSMVKSNNRMALFFSYSLAVLLILMGVFSPHILYGEKDWYWGFPDWNLRKSSPFFIYWFSFFLATGWQILKFIRASQTPYKKSQAKLVLLALGCLSFVHACTTFGVGFYPLGFIGIFVFISTLFYAIVKYRLMDFNLIVRWELAFATSIVSLCLIFLAAAYFAEKMVSHFFEDAKFYPTLIALAIFVFMFEPLRRKITKIVDLIIFKSPDFQAILSGITGQLKQSQTLQSITTGLAEQFKKIWDVDHVGFAMWNNQQNQFDLFPEQSFAEQIIKLSNETIDRKDFLVKTLESERRLFAFGIVIDEDLIELSERASAGEKATFAKIRRSMRWLGASATIPLMLNTELIGFIILGPKKDKTLYNDDDKKFLAHVAEIVSDTIKNIILSQPLDLSQLKAG